MEYKQPSEAGLIVCSPAMSRIYSAAAVLSRSTIPVLIQGESGTGKSRLAEFMKREGPFIRVDCNAIAPELFSSELFGYTPNAFTGASVKGKVGLLEAAHHGTVLFDEVNELSMENQVLLLHFLQNKSIMPLGALESRKIDARVIATSGRDLLTMTKEGSFRKDLYYRLCASKLTLPPLRERKEEIPIFIEHFIQKYSEEFQIDPKAIKLSSEQMERLMKLDWVGNIREIENFVQQLCFLGDTAEGVETCIERAADSFKNVEFVPRPARLPRHKPLKEAMREFEKEYLQRVIDDTADLHEAAEVLGIGFSTLCRKKAELGVYRRHTSFAP